MKRILLVDDDPVVVRIYGDGLRAKGFEVDSVEDGLAAAKYLQTAKPDAIVLDLMMPKLSGVDVLKYLRGQADLANVPVVVLSNAYMTDLTREAEAAGADKGLLKLACTPAIVAETLEKLLNGEATGGAEEGETEAEERPGAPIRSPAAPPTRSPPGAFLRQMLPSEGQTEPRQGSRVRQRFLERGPATLSSLRGLFRAFHKAGNGAQCGLRLESLHTKVHFLTVTARVGECHHLAQMSSVVEALLLELISCPERITPSVMRTLAVAVDFLGVLFEHDKKDASGPAPAGEVLALVLDDDAVCRHVIISALHHASFKAEGAGDPVSTLASLSKKQYGLISLDLEMPGMDGFEFCRHLRELAGYQHTPVIYVTGHREFESRVKGALSGVQDLITKPIFPMELAVRAVMQTLKFQLLSAPDSQ
ncbi:MAG TPA: response regulator [Dongiaceae bacterium]|nr:response regulator [Dongiaceae bacterium]